MTFRRAGVWCGLVAPALWVLTIAAAGAARPGFSHVTQYISELGEAGSQGEPFMRYAAFGATGVMYVAFAAALASFAGGRALVWCGAALIAVNGLGRIGAGFFPCDMGCAGATPSPTQEWHSFFATLAFAASVLASLSWTAVFLRPPTSRRMAAFSLLCGAIGLTGLLLMVTHDDPGMPRGLYERVSSGVLSLWVAGLAWWARREL